MDVMAIYEYRLRPLQNNGCQLDCRVLPLTGKELSPEMQFYLFEHLRKSCGNLKEFCERSVMVQN